MTGPINVYDEMYLSEAIKLAVHFHHGQRDKSGSPYIYHPLTVMLSMDKDDYEGQIVAILHDILEDTNCLVNDLYFPKNIVDAVLAITKAKSETNKEYWTRVKKNPIALRVKLKDIEHNSSEERLMAIPTVEERDYLREKYKKALKFLKE